MFVIKIYDDIVKMFSILFLDFKMVDLCTGDFKIVYSSTNLFLCSNITSYEPSISTVWSFDKYF